MPKYAHIMLIRILSSLLLVMFIVTQGSISLFAESLQNPIKTLSEIKIPDNLGRVEEVYKSTGCRIPGGKECSQKQIIFIQDAHDSLEAQENISKIVLDLTERQGVGTVYEEGYEGPVPTDSFFSFMQDAKIKEKVSYFFMDKLRIGGAEYAHINRKKDFRLIGADSIKLHLKNIRQYQKTAAGQKEISEDLELLLKELNALASKLLPNSITEYFKLRARYDENKIELIDYLNRIKTIALKTDLKVDAEVYPFIFLLLSAHDSQTPEMIQRIQDIEPKQLFMEVDRFENDFAMSAIKTDRERKIYTYKKELILIKRLNELQVSPQEYESVRNALRNVNTAELAKWISSQTQKTVVVSKIWEKSIRGALKFYRIAAERDKYIENNLKDFIKNRQEQNAVIVFGGYHKKNIKTFLRMHDISYAVVSPRISGEDLKHHEYYRELMTTGHHAYELPVSLAKTARPQDLMTLPAARSEIRNVYELALKEPALDFPLFDRDVLNFFKRKSSRSELRANTRNAEYFKTHNIPSELTGLFKPEIMEVLLADPTMVPAYLINMSQVEGGKYLGAPEYLNKELLDKIGGLEKLNEFAGFSVGDTASAVRALSQGIPLMIGLRDKYEDKKIFKFSIASERQVYFPLSRGLWLGIKGSGLSGNGNTNFYFNAEKNKWWGLVTKSESDQAVEWANGLRKDEREDLLNLPGGPAVQTLMIQPLFALPNVSHDTVSLSNVTLGFEYPTMDYGWESTAQPIYGISSDAATQLNLANLNSNTSSSSPRLVFNLFIGTPHRFEKFFQILDSDPGFERTRREISQGLIETGNLKPGTILTKSEWMMRVIKNLGQEEGVRGFRYDVKTLQPQDFTISGQRADNEEVLIIPPGTHPYVKDITDAKAHGLHGIQVKLRMILRIMAGLGAEREVFFPDPKTAVMIFFESYFKELKPEELKIWTENYIPELDKPQPLWALDKLVRMDLFHPSADWESIQRADLAQSEKQRFSRPEGIFFNPSLHSEIIYEIQALAIRISKEHSSVKDHEPILRSELRSPQPPSEYVEIRHENDTLGLIPVAINYIDFFAQLIAHDVKQDDRTGEDSPQLTATDNMLIYELGGLKGSKLLLGFNLMPFNIPIAPGLTKQGYREIPLNQVEYFLKNSDFIPDAYETDHPIILEMTPTPDRKKIKVTAVYIGGFKPGQFLKYEILQKKEGSDNYEPFSVYELTNQSGKSGLLLPNAPGILQVPGHKEIQINISREDLSRMLIRGSYVPDPRVKRSEMRADLKGKKDSRQSPEKNLSIKKIQQASGSSFEVGGSDKEQDFRVSSSDQRDLNSLKLRFSGLYPDYEYSEVRTSGGRGTPDSFYFFDIKKKDKKRSELRANDKLKEPRAKELAEQGLLLKRLINAGTGAFVYEAERKSDGEKVAVRIPRNDYDYAPPGHEDFEDEPNQGAFGDEVYFGYFDNSGTYRTHFGVAEPDVEILKGHDLDFLIGYYGSGHVRGTMIKDPKKRNKRREINFPYEVIELLGADWANLESHEGREALRALGPQGALAKIVKLAADMEKLSEYPAVKGSLGRLVYSDIKEDNIMINLQTGELKLVDLGSIYKLDEAVRSHRYLSSRNTYSVSLLENLSRGIFKGDTEFSDTVSKLTSIRKQTGGDDLSRWEKLQVYFKNISRSELRASDSENMRTSGLEDWESFFKRDVLSKKIFDELQAGLSSKLDHYLLMTELAWLYKSGKVPLEEIRGGLFALTVLMSSDSFYSYPNDRKQMIEYAELLKRIFNSSKNFDGYLRTGWHGRVLHFDLVTLSDPEPNLSEVQSPEKRDALVRLLLLNQDGGNGGLEEALRDVSGEPNLTINDLKAPLSTVRIQAGSIQDVYLVLPVLKDGRVIPFVLMAPRLPQLNATVEAEYRNFEKFRGDQRTVHVIGLARDGNAVGYTSRFSNTEEFVYAARSEVTMNGETPGSFTKNSDLPFRVGEISDRGSMTKVTAAFAAAATYFYDPASQSRISRFTSTAGDLNFYDSEFQRMPGSDFHYEVKPGISKLKTRLIAMRGLETAVTPVKFMRYLFSLEYLAPRPEEIIATPAFHDSLLKGVFDGVLEGLEDKLNDTKLAQQTALEWFNAYLKDLEETQDGTVRLPLNVMPELRGRIRLLEREISARSEMRMQNPWTQNVREVRVNEARTVATVIFEDGKKVELSEKLGEGVYNEFYVYHENGRRLLLKVIKPGLSIERQIKGSDSLANEARISGVLNRGKNMKNVTNVLWFGSVPGVGDALLISGPDAESLKDWRARLTPQERAGIFRQYVEQIWHAYEGSEGNSVALHDLKPVNALLEVGQNQDGSRRYTVHVIDLEAGKMSNDTPFRDIWRDTFPYLPDIEMIGMLMEVQGRHKTLGLVSFMELLTFFQDFVLDDDAMNSGTKNVEKFIHRKDIGVLKNIVKKISGYEKYRKIWYYDSLAEGSLDLHALFSDLITNLRVIENLKARRISVIEKLWNWGIAKMSLLIRKLGALFKKKNTQITFNDSQSTQLPPQPVGDRVLAEASTPLPQEANADPVIQFQKLLYSMEMTGPQFSERNFIRSGNRTIRELSSLYLLSKAMDAAEQADPSVYNDAEADVRRVYGWLHRPVDDYVEDAIRHIRSTMIRPRSEMRSSNSEKFDFEDEKVRVVVSKELHEGVIKVYDKFKGKELLAGESDFFETQASNGRPGSIRIVFHSEPKYFRDDSESFYRGLYLLLKNRTDLEIAHFDPNEMWREALEWLSERPGIEIDGLHLSVHFKENYNFSARAMAERWNQIKIGSDYRENAYVHLKNLFIYFSAETDKSQLYEHLMFLLMDDDFVLRRRVVDEILKRTQIPQALFLEHLKDPLISLRDFGAIRTQGSEFSSATASANKRLALLTIFTQLADDERAKRFGVNPDYATKFRREIKEVFEKEAADCKRNLNLSGDILSSVKVDPKGGLGLDHRMGILEVFLREYFRYVYAAEIKKEKDGFAWLHEYLNAALWKMQLSETSNLIQVWRPRLRSEMRAAPALKEIFGTPVGSVIDYGTADGSWLLGLQKKNPAWVSAGATLIPVDNDSPQYYEAYGQVLGIDEEGWDEHVSEQLKKIGDRVAPKDAGDIIFDEKSPAILHAAFLPKDVMEDRNFGRLLKNLPPQSWIVIASSKNVSPQVEWDRLLIEHGIAPEHIQIFNSKTGFPADYPKTFWWSHFPINDNYLIVAQKSERRSELRVEALVKEVLGAVSTEEKINKLKALIEASEEISERINRTRTLLTYLSPYPSYVIRKNDAALFEFSFRSGEFKDSAGGKTYRFERNMGRRNYDIGQDEFFDFVLLDKDWNRVTVKELFERAGLGAVINHLPLEKGMLFHYDKRQKRLKFFDPLFENYGARIVLEFNAEAKMTASGMETPLSPALFLNDYGDDIPLFNMHFHPSEETDLSSNDIAFMASVGVPELVATPSMRAKLWMPKDTKVLEGLLAHAVWHKLSDLLAKGVSREFFVSMDVELSGRSEMRLMPAGKKINVRQSLKNLNTPALVYMDYKNLMEKFWDAEKKTWNAQGVEIIELANMRADKIRLVIYGADIMDERLNPFRELRESRRNVRITNEDAQTAYRETQKDFVKGLKHFVNIHISKDSNAVKKSFTGTSKDEMFFFRYEAQDNASGLLAAALLWEDFADAGKKMDGITRDSEGFLVMSESYMRQLVQSYEAGIVIALSA